MCGSVLLSFAFRFRGRRAYRRVATFICYMFYKHTTLAVGDIFYAHQIAPASQNTSSQAMHVHPAGVSRFVPQIAYAEWLNSASEPQASSLARAQGVPVADVVEICLRHLRLAGARGGESGYRHTRRGNFSLGYPSSPANQVRMFVRCLLHRRTCTLKGYSSGQSAVQFLQPIWL